jgi:hypothetical protein
MFKSRTEILAGRRTNTGEMKTTHKIILGNLKGKV